MVSGELKSLFEITPVLNQNTCGALNVSAAEMRSAASRRVRKSRGEHPAPARLRHSMVKQQKIAWIFSRARMRFIIEWKF
jgi:hypothetical protein